MLNLNSASVQSNIVRVAEFSAKNPTTKRAKNLKGSYSAADCALFFDLFSLTQSNNLALGYFSINPQQYQALLGEVQTDRWSVNWADYFKHFFLKLSFMDQPLDGSLLQHEASRLHFYWDGYNWFYLYIWDGKTQHFIEVMSTEDNTVHFRQGQGQLTQLETLARITTTEYPGKAFATPVH